MHDVQDLIAIFDRCFFDSHNTRLMAGETEPVYLPAKDGCAWHRICFANGFFSSALHECAHWFIAGEKRRQLEDYGYWYAPDGRDARQQEIFYQVEIKPQALECLLSRAARYPFHVSSDNLNGDCAKEQEFALAVQSQVESYEKEGLPPRAEKFYRALRAFYQELSLSRA